MVENQTHTLSLSLSRPHARAMLSLRALQRVTGAFLQGCAVSRAHYTVMSYGDASQGALGQGQRTGSVAADAYEPAPIEALPRNIVRIAAGHYHSLALSSDGHLWTWGRNNEGQLGRGTSLSREDCICPQMVKGLEGVEVKDMVGSGVISMAIDVHGSLWAWGKSKRGQLGLGDGIIEAVNPQLVQALSGQHILQVSLGWGHGLACTIDGSLYAWGYPQDRRLGYLLDDIYSHKSTKFSTCHLAGKQGVLLEDAKMEKNIMYQWEPLLVPLDDLKAISVSCGFDHSLVLCENGILLSFGDNGYGQLGRSPGTRESAKEWEVPLPGHVSFVSSGLGHSLAVCNRDKDSSADKGDSSSLGSVYSWGWNSAFQLGRTGCSGKPMQIERWMERRVVSVDGGRVHSLAIDNECGLWTWGSGKNGRLGLGSFGDEQEPCLVESIEELRVQQAACGMDHTIILVSEK